MARTHLCTTGSGFSFPRLVLPLPVGLYLPIWRGISASRLAGLRFPKRGSVASHFGVSVACKDFRFPKTDFRFPTRVARNSGNNDQASVEGKFFSRICISTWLEIAANVNEQQLSRERVKIFLHAYAGIGKPAYYFMKDLHR